MRVYSKHSLINGTGAGESSSPANSEDRMSEKIPTWGYKGGEAKIFDLEPGEKLPAGWADSPTAVVELPPEQPKKPAKAKKADAESEAISDEIAVDGDSD